MTLTEIDRMQEIAVYRTPEGMLWVNYMDGDYKGPLDVANTLLMGAQMMASQVGATIAPNPPKG